MLANKRMQKKKLKKNIKTKKKITVMENN